MPAGRPKTEINLEEAEKLGALMCTLEECAAWLNVNISTLSMHTEFLEAYKRGKQRGKMSLRRQLIEHAKKNYAAAIWLSKQHLGMRDIPVDDDEDTFELIDNWGGDNEGK